MKPSDINKKWDKLNQLDVINGFQALRFSSLCIPELYVALNKDGNRCLILFLNNSVTEISPSVNSIREHLELKIFWEEQMLVIILRDQYFQDLFNDLVLSVYIKIKSLSIKDAWLTYIKTFNKWAEFFEGKMINQLSEHELQGLIGELFLMKEMMASGEYLPDNILKSWKGPYDAGKDFEFEDQFIEVKTTSENGFRIKISSEYQLQHENDRPLKLVLFLLRPELINGQSLFMLASEIRDLILSGSGDLFIFLKGLKQKGLSFSNLHDYDNKRFAVLRKTEYDCGNDRFPKIIRSNLPNSIEKVNYYLRLNEISDFIVEEKTYYK